MRKGSFLARATDALALGHTEVIVDRVESWSAGRGRHDLVTARAVGPLPVLLDRGAPARPTGALVAWKGRRVAAEEANGLVAAEVLAMSPATAHVADPSPGAAYRTLYVSTKVGSTPNRFPRRPGMALKRPAGTDQRGESSSPANL